MQTLFLCSDKEARWVGVMAVSCGHRALLVLVLEVGVCVMYNYRILHTCTYVDSVGGITWLPSVHNT